MPRYDTKCTVCGHEEEVIIKMADPLPPCNQRIIDFDTTCGGTREKVPSTTAIAFRGGGWTPKHY